MVDHDVVELNNLHIQISCGRRSITIRSRNKAKVRDWVAAVNDAGLRPPEGWCYPHRFGSFAPPRGLTDDGSQAQWFVDGRSAFEAIALSIERAKSETEIDEVEPWVVKAINAKLIDCKIDQMNQVIKVSHFTESVFGPCQWQGLREKLATYRLVLDSHRWVPLPAVGFSSNSFGEESQEDVTPPPSLMDHPPLVVFVNGVSAAMNELRLRPRRVLSRMLKLPSHPRRLLLSVV